MKYIITLGAFALAALIFAPQTAAAPSHFPEIVKSPEQPPSMDLLLFQSADRYGADPAIMMKVAKCESEMNPNAIGDQGTSFGIAQIHLPAHPDITKDQALDPAFAFDFMAKEMAGGRSSKWSCFRILYPQLLH